MAELVLAHDQARAFAVDALRAAGMCQADADSCADSMVEASLRGIDSHGVVALLPTFVAQGRGGVGHGTGPIVVVETAATALVDGNGASGPRTARLAMDEAAARARTLGVGVAVARRVGYLGALSWIVVPAAADGLVALASCNSMAFVAPHGGRAALHGTNPIATAVPAEPDPIVVDMRTNAFHMRDWWESMRTGAPLPAGSLARADGSEVRHPTDIDGWDGVVSLPLAGAKGYGLGLLVDVLTAALGGGAIGTEVSEQTERDGLGALVLAIDPSAFGPAERFADAVARLGAQAHAIPPVDPAEPVRLPGERAAATRRERLAHGIPVADDLWRELHAQLADLDVPTPDLGGLQ